MTNAVSRVVALHCWARNLLSLIAVAVTGAHGIVAVAQITYTPAPPSVFWGQEPTTYPGTEPTTLYGAIRMNSTTWNTVETSRPLALSSWDFTVIDKYHTNFPAGTDFLYTLYRTPTATGFGNSSDVEAPHDVYTSAACDAPLSGVNTTDCELKEYIVGLMEHTCGVSSVPTQTPPTNNCWIKNFEMWNEFNGNGFWNDKIQTLAQMGQDAAYYIRLFCGDCKVSAGSVSGGGAGGLTPATGGYTPDPNGDGQHSYYDTTMEVMLDDWYSINPNTMPDFISWHPYPTWERYTNVNGHSVPIDPMPFPESAVSGDGKGEDNNDGTGTDLHNGSAGCPQAITGEYTPGYPQCGDAVSYQADKMINDVATSTYHMAGKPVWATEGGYEQLYDLQGTTTTGGGVTERDVLRADFMARWLILLSWRGVARAYPYSYDNACWMPQNMTAAATCTPNPAVYGWTPEYVPAGETSAGTAWLQVEDWLSGATTPSCTVNSSHQYSCTMTRTSPSGYHATIFWADPWAASDSFTPTPPSGEHFTQYRDLSGNEYTYSGGSITLTGSPLIFEGIN